MRRIQCVSYLYKTTNNKINDLGYLQAKAIDNIYTSKFIPINSPFHLKIYVNTLSTFTFKTFYKHHSPIFKC